ncbi:MAG TPA: J domain-containing protein [Spirochaetota bacterium]|nr:J domain-containing protein [Spirochaetota bacterium]HPS85206.1 J domain-containing protein [Spirochaetota bacterium]
MEIALCYRILQIGETSTDEDISRSFKAMAMKYHPDKNPQRREWANEQMTVLNTAYSTLMSYRFNQGSAEAAQEFKKSEEEHRAKPASENADHRNDAQRGYAREEDREYLISKFVKAREDAKDGMYRYFQYNLYNFHRREERGNRKIYNDIIVSLRKSYHLIKKYSSLTRDRELLEHFNIFGKMIFDFYRASECLNIIDSYNDSYEVDAYRMYRRGDEHLHKTEKELFFDRHNRGFIDRRKTVPELLDAEHIFRRTLQLYKDSSWAVESSIKLEYVLSLKDYISLFFSEE